MDYPSIALDLFRQGYNCSQSVFAAFHDTAGLSREQALALSSPFGGGIGRMREVCGAFNGLLMLCGAVKGNDRTELEEREKIYAVVQHYAEVFKKEFGSLYCRDLLGLSVDSKETARPSERTEQYYRTRPCLRCIEFCARLGESLVEQAQ